jgi:DNA modification methylase
VIHHRCDDVLLLQGEVVDALTVLPDGMAQTVVTSPPYFGLRDYGDEAQLGGEGSPAEYVANMVEVFQQVRRVLADNGTLWLNLGDSYYSGRGASTGVDAKQSARRGFVRALDKPGQPWARPKNLLGIPWRVAFALQDDGWNIRSEVIWSKPNAMPDPTRDRPSRAHEHLFMFTKQRFYYYDRAAISRDVWSVPTVGFKEAHFATFPPELVRPCIKAGSRAGDIVLDPFSGSGTSGMVALEEGRRFCGVDLNADYLDLSMRTRLANCC